MSIAISTKYQAPNPNPIQRLEDLYPMGFETPAGYELTGEFRPPLKGDLFIPAFEKSSVQTSNGLHTSTDPRLILRKAKVKVVTFRATGEKRLPKKDEWYLGVSGGMLWKALSDHYGRETYEIFTRTETEE